MTTPLDLYEYAEGQGIDVDWVSTVRATSLSIPLPDGSYAIAVNPWKLDTLEQETVCLAHELGHCKTGSFYNRHAALDLRQKHENRADKWAIQRLVPERDLDQAVSDGYTDLPSLAEHFGVTIPFMRNGCLLVHPREIWPWSCICDFPPACGQKITCPIRTRMGADEMKEFEEYRAFTTPAELHKAVNTLRGIVAGINS